MTNAAKELYFDISSEERGGSLFRMEKDGKTVFYFNHSEYDDRRDEIRVLETYYDSFSDFWTALTRDPQWFYQHPLFVHPEQRHFVNEQLKKVNWNIQSNKKWQDSHQRQWTKVLGDPAAYYAGPKKNPDGPGSIKDP